MIILRLFLLLTFIIRVALGIILLITLTSCATIEEPYSVYFCADDRLYYDYGYKVMLAGANCEYLTTGIFEEVLIDEKQSSKETKTFNQAY